MQQKTFASFVSSTHHEQQGRVALRTSSISGEKKKEKTGQEKVFKFNMAKHFPGYVNVLNLYIQEGQKIPRKGKFKEKLPIHIKVQTAKHQR